MDERYSSANYRAVVETRKQSNVYSCTFNSRVSEKIMTPPASEKLQKTNLF